MQIFILVFVLGDFCIGKNWAWQYRESFYWEFLLESYLKPFPLFDIHHPCSSSKLSISLSQKNSLRSSFRKILTSCTFSTKNATLCSNIHSRKSSSTGQIWYSRRFFASPRNIFIFLVFRISLRVRNISSFWIALYIEISLYLIFFQIIQNAFLRIVQ